MSFVNEHVEDYRLLGYLKRRLKEDQFCYAMKNLHSLAFCSVRTIKAPMHKPGVYVIANNETAKIWGVQLCDSPWACPVCSAKKMSQVATKIAAGIDGLLKQNKAAFMITFSIPHIRRFTAKQTYNILYETWKRFAHHVGSKSTTYIGNKDPLSAFVREFNCTYRVRVCEWTWGSQGWHPHFHCLFWVDKNRLQEVADWQQRLSDKWRYLAEKFTVKILERDGFDPANGYTDSKLVGQSVKQWVHDLYERCNSRRSDPDAYISVDKTGKVRQAQSSQYICGWGADKELTGNIRKQASHEGHFTPMQMLQISFNAYKQRRMTRADKYLKLFLEYALATKKKYRTRFSHALSAFIAKYMSSQKYIETLKKKATEAKEAVGVWKTVCWFNEQQWYRICHCDLVVPILERARLPDALQQITALLEQYCIDPIGIDNPPDKQWFEDNFFNAIA